MEKKHEVFYTGTRQFVPSKFSESDNSEFTLTILNNTQKGRRKLNGITVLLKHMKHTCKNIVTGSEGSFLKYKIRAFMVHMKMILSLHNYKKIKHEQMRIYRIHEFQCNFNPNDILKKQTNGAKNGQHL